MTSHPNHLQDSGALHPAIVRVADWHGEQAAKAYRENDIDAYVRHAGIADRLWGTRS